MFYYYFFFFRINGKNRLLYVFCVGSLLGRARHSYAREFKWNQRERTIRIWPLRRVRDLTHLFCPTRISTVSRIVSTEKHTRVDSCGVAVADSKGDKAGFRTENNFSNFHLPGVKYRRIAMTNALRYLVPRPPPRTSFGSGIAVSPTKPIFKHRIPYVKLLKLA